MPKFVPKKVVVTFTPNTLYENIHFSTPSLPSCQFLNLMGEKYGTSVICYSFPVTEEALVDGSFAFLPL